MSAKDTFHESVKCALEKEDWRITHDPLHLSFADVDIYIDLGAEKLLAAERNKEKIAVEIKSFLSASALSDFHTAVGQFLNYRFVLSQQEPERKLYLAVPISIYETFFKRELIQRLIEVYQLKLIVYNPNAEVIEVWIS